jgi:acetoin utilization deacetylase AcuC-like enzyme
MPRLFLAPKPTDAADDKCEWIVDSLAAHRTRYSRAVKVLDVDEEQAKTRRSLFATGQVPPQWPDLRELVLGEVHSGDYVHAALGTEQPTSGASQQVSRGQSSAARSWGYVKSLRWAARDVSDGIQGSRGSANRIAGALGGGMHHARRDSGWEDHVFNGLAAVAHELAGNAALGCGPILILDLDGSCGGGTASMIAGMPHVRMVDIAVNRVDAYESSPNTTLRIVVKASHYLDTVRESLEALDVAKETLPVCIYSGGVDGFEGMSNGLPGMTADLLAERDRLVFDWCTRVGIRTAYTLGCGDVSDAVPAEALVALHRQTIEAAAAASRGERS